MADIKEQGMTKMTKLNAGDYIRIVTADGNSALISKSDMMNVCLSAVKETLSAGYEVKSLQTGEGGVFFTPDKYIGHSGSDGGDSILLIAQITSGVFELWRGCIGRFQFGRGDITSSNTSFYADITLTKAYNSITAKCNCAWDKLSLGTCVYNEKRYLALHFSSTPHFGISFSGRYSGNCSFLPVAYSQVTEWTDI
jgi:hypothetical protein